MKVRIYVTMRHVKYIEGPSSIYNFELYFLYYIQAVRHCDTSDFVLVIKEQYAVRIYMTM